MLLNLCLLLCCHCYTEATRAFALLMVLMKSVMAISTGLGHAKRVRPAVN